MASLVPTHTMLHDEVEQEFSELHLEMVHCELCGDYHPPELHLTRFTAFDDEEPTEA